MHRKGKMLGTTPNESRPCDTYLGMAFRQRDVVFSLQCRGKHVEDMNKMDLLDLLYDDIVLEKKACSLQ